jgi:hypothetical protein
VDNSSRTSNQSRFKGLVAGTYDVVITDANGSTRLRLHQNSSGDHPASSSIKQYDARKCIVLWCWKHRLIDLTPAGGTTA